jgi:hypothetical protein
MTAAAGATAALRRIAGRDEDRRSVRNWVERGARAGFAAKGIVYLVLGGLALRFALGQGGQLTDPHGAVVRLLSTPYGRLLVGAVAVGLAFYAGWRFLEAFADANRRGSDRGGLLARAKYAISGAVYGILAVDAMTLASGTGGGNSANELPSTLLGGVLTRWVAVLVALGLIGYGLTQLRHALKAKLGDQLSVGRVERHAGPWAVLVSRIGIGGRAIVLVAMGFILARRAMTSPRAAAETDTGDSLRLIAALPTGEWLLVAIAAGLMAYGLFQLVEARYRTISPP